MLRLRMMMSRGEEDDVENCVEEAEDNDTEEEEEEDRSQDRAAQIVRACAVEMHLERSREPL